MIYAHIGAGLSSEETEVLIAALDLSDIEVGKNYQGLVLVTKCQVMRASNGPYLALEITDGKKEMKAKRWKSETPLTPGVVYSIKCEGASYQGVKEVHIKGAIMTETDPANFRKGGPNDSLTLYENLLTWAEELDFEEYKNLCVHFLKKHKEECLTHVAAVGVHHNYWGGWIQHVYEVVHIASSIVTALETTTPMQINSDLVFTGALLHDIGKLEGYTMQNGVIDLTFLGKMVEHTALGIIAARELCKACNTPPHIEGILLHCIGAHHGKLEYGATVLPNCIEAYIISEADNLSAKCTVMHEATTAEGQDFTEKNFVMGTRIYKGDTRGEMDLPF